MKMDIHPLKEDRRMPPLCHSYNGICEKCPKWEPIPFHSEGGVCLINHKKYKQELFTLELGSRELMVVEC